jgi:hypothetical protein
MDLCAPSDKKQRRSPHDFNEVYASLGGAAELVAVQLPLSSLGGKLARLIGMYFRRDFFHMIKKGRVCIHPECTEFLATSVSRLSCAASVADVEAVLADVFILISNSLAGSAFVPCTLETAASKVGGRRCPDRHEHVYQE